MGALGGEAGSSAAGRKGGVSAARGGDCWFQI